MRENYGFSTILQTFSIHSMPSQILVKRLKASAVFALIAFSAFAVFPQNAFAVSYAFDPIVNISNNAGVSQEPRIKASGSDVFVVWNDGGDISFDTSSDGGSTFSGTTSLSSATASHDPQLALVGGNVYVAWQEGSSPSDIVFRRSTDGGTSFDAAKTISASGPTSILPKINGTGTNVYITWQQNTDIYFSRSTDSGANFDAPVALESGSTSSSAPQMAIDGTNVYVVWKEDNDISFRKSTDSGANFDSSVNISGSGAGTISQRPAIIASGGDVYVVWQEGSNINFKKSSDGGSTFGSAITLGPTNTSSDPTPMVSVSGSYVYVVWRENNTGEISFIRSTDGGDTFETKQNLSDNSGSSVFPQMAVSGDSVAVVWRDSTPGNTEVFFAASNNNGEAFGSPKNLSSNSVNSETPQIALTSTHTFVVWDDAEFGNRDILFVAGTPSPISISFDKSQYTLSESALITVTDAAADTTVGVDHITIKIKSSSDTTGFDLDFAETGGSTGVFTNTISFDKVASSAADKKILAKAGDTITALLSASGDTGTASIFPITISFKKSGIAFTSFDYGHIVNPEIEDKNANLDAGAIDTINVNIKSGADTTGITLTLRETGVNTGIFGGSASKLIFMNGDHLFPTSGTITVTQKDATANINPASVDTTTVQVTSTTDPGGITITLTETGVNTGSFSGKLTLSPSASVAGSTIHVAAGDILSVTSTTFTSNGLITPNPNSDVGAIKVAFEPPLTTDDTVTATYSTASPKDITVADTGSGGGGGGGLVRPGLVLDAVAGIFGGSGGGSGSPGLTLDQLNPKVIKMPDEVKQIINTFDKNTPLKPIPQDKYPDFNFPLSIDSKGYPLSGFTNTIETNVIKTNEKSSWKLTLYDPDLQHVSLYMDLKKGTTDPSQSDAQILYNVGAPVKIVDPKGYFGKVTLSQKDDGKFTNLVFLDITFAKPMEKSDLIIRTWNARLFSMDTIVQDALQVVQSTESVQAQQATSSEASLEVQKPVTPQEQPQEQKLQEETQQKTQIPSWVKTNADWWSQDQIKDSEFVSGIQYLIQNNIIKVPQTEASGQASSDIPAWVKNNAGWWASGGISDGDFVKGLQYLISHGIIKI